MGCPVEGDCPANAEVTSHSGEIDLWFFDSLSQCSTGLSYYKNMSNKCKEYCKYCIKI